MSDHSAGSAEASAVASSAAERIGQETAASPEGVATDATCYLRGIDQTGAVRIDADSTLDFSVWAMGTAAEATKNLPGIALVLFEGL